MIAFTKTKLGQGILLFAALALVWLLLIRPYRNSHLEAVTPKIGPAIQAVYATGTVEGTVMFEVRPRVAGRLTNLYVDEGQKLVKDQLLAQLEDDEQQASLKELQARLDFAQSYYARQIELNKTRANSKETVERARADLHAAQAAWQNMSARADYLKLFSPADCTVIKRDGELGQLILPEQVIFWLMCGNKLRVTAEVDEEDITLIKPGQRVYLRADAFPGQTFETQVSSITPRGDPIARSFRVRIDLPADTPFLIGMTVENNIIIRQSQTSLLIPSSAVNNNSVWLIEDGKLLQRSITIGARDDTQTEILSGLDEKSVLLRSPEAVLKVGQNVNYTISNNWR